MKNHLKFRTDGKGKYLKVIFPIHCIKTTLTDTTDKTLFSLILNLKTENPPKCNSVNMELPIQNFVQCLHIQKPGILRILECSELFDNCIPTHIHTPCHIYKHLQIFKTMTYLKPKTYLEPSKRFN